MEKQKRKKEREKAQDRKTWFCKKQNRRDIFKVDTTKLKYVFVNSQNIERLKKKNETRIRKIWNEKKEENKERKRKPWLTKWKSDENKNGRGSVEESGYLLWKSKLKACMQRKKKASIVLRQRKDGWLFIYF